MLTSAVVPLARATATRVRSPERTRRARTLPRGSSRTLRCAIAHREQGDRLWRFPALDFSRSLSGRTPRARGGMAYYATQRSPDRRGALRRGRLRARCAPSFESSPSRVSRSRARRDRRARLPPPVTPLTRQKTAPLLRVSRLRVPHQLRVVRRRHYLRMVRLQIRSPSPATRGIHPLASPVAPRRVSFNNLRAIFKVGADATPRSGSDPLDSRRSRPRRCPPPRAPAPVPPDPPDSDAHPAPIHRPPLPPVQVR